MKNDIDLIREVVKTSENFTQIFNRLQKRHGGQALREFKNFCLKNNIDISHLPSSRFHEKNIRMSILDDQIVKVSENSFSCAEALRKLGLKDRLATNVLFLKRKLYLLNIDVDWFGSRCRIGKKLPWMMNPDIEPYISNEKQISSRRLKEKLIKLKKIELKCSICGIIDWCGKLITLQLDHINGDRYDNRLENLRILCPNCHSQTETYSKGKINKPKPIKEQVFCLNCKKEISNSLSLRCVNCANNANIKINWPSTKELLKLIENSNITEVARKLCVSRNALKKRIQNHPND